jgi:hypothetical protein
MSRKLKAGDWVEVRSVEEIVGTLDERGQLEGMPFMPEMLPYCGQRFQVSKRAHKTCDPPSGLCGRRMPGTVHLDDLRCNGAAHGGCQAGCLFFWKERWLKPAPESSAAPAHAGHSLGGSIPAIVSTGARAPGESPDSQDPVYVCQNTQVHMATQPLQWWDPRQYLEDLTSGNVSLSQMAAAFLYFLYSNLAEAGLGIGSAMRWVYDLFQKVRGGAAYPFRLGKVPKGLRTPSVKLDVQPGELVRVRSYPDILQTLDEDWRNRGMYFDGEMVPFCNKSFRVLQRVEKIIDERTGKMLKLKNDAIILENVFCQARYAKFRRFCPRAIFAYWREAWLERDPSQTPKSAETSGGVR